MPFEVFERDGIVRAADVMPFVDSHRALTAAVASGELTRLRRGSYVRTARWSSLEPAGRHLLRMRAVEKDAVRPFVAAGLSAAAAWGMPLRTFPEVVTLLDPWRGGGRSEPGVRRTARAASSARTLRVSGFAATDLARTALDAARGVPFDEAVARLDWALSRRKRFAVSLAELVELLDELRAPRSLRNAVSFATHLSDSFGETRGRCRIVQLGFPLPELQHKIVDRDGDMELDYYWRRYGVGGEFDGKMKYTRQQYTGGDPAEVVWREKQREDRLRRHVSTVIRIVYDDLADPGRLRAKLIEHGVFPER